MELNELRGKIVDAAVQVHIKLGPGQFEEVCMESLIIKLEKRKLEVKSEMYLPIVSDAKLIDMTHQIILSVLLCFCGRSGSIRKMTA